MAKGKQALAAANRRHQAALDHIDRLTDEITALKIRARAAEERARQLDGVQHLVDTVSPKNDALIVEMTEKLRQWKRIAEEDAKRRKAAWIELCDAFIKDMGFAKVAGLADMIEFLNRRYPAIVLALNAGNSSKGDHIVHHVPTEVTQKRLSGDDLRRFQRLTGLRTVHEGAEGKDTADVLIDLLDARQAGFTPEDVAEFARSAQASARGRATR